MAWARWITLVWPGLTQLWFSGAWWGLAIGCGFAWLLNLALVSTLVWTELIGPGARVGVWGLVVLVWGSAVAISLRQLQSGEGQGTPKVAEDLFRRAQREYLTGNWIKAEQLLTHLIRINQKDIDAQLLLAGLLRRTGQWSEASGRLRRLLATDGAEKWKSEIDRERRLLEQELQAQRTKATDESNHTQPDKPELEPEALEHPPATHAA